QLIASLERTHTKFQPDQSFSLVDVHLNQESRVISKKWMKENLVAKLMELRFRLVPYPPYSPDLAPSDYYLFLNMKKWLAGRFYLNEEVIAKTNAYFAELDHTY
ncbi:Histone-lysine N-methyltransferase SETMAR, partial [Camponotus floridanus]